MKPRNLVDVRLGSIIKIDDLILEKYDQVTLVFKDKWPLMQSVLMIRQDHQVGQDRRR
jgi:hypothetical protein